MVKIIKETIRELQYEEESFNNDTEFSSHIILDDIFRIKSNKNSNYDIDFNIDHILIKSIIFNLVKNGFNPTIIDVKYKKNNFSNDIFKFKFSVKSPLEGAAIFTLKCKFLDDNINNIELFNSSENVYKCYVKTEYMDFNDGYNMTTYAESTFDFSFNMFENNFCKNYKEVDFIDIFGRSIKKYILKNTKTLIGK